MPRPLLLWALKNDWGGLRSGSAIEAQANQASRLENLYREIGVLRRRKGTTPLGTADLSPVQDQDGLEWFKISATEYLLAAHNGRVVDWFAAAAQVTNSSGKLTSGTDANFTWLDEKVVIGDGLKQNIRFNGTRIDQVLPQAPATPLSAAAGAAGNPDGTYTYYVTFLSADANNSELSPLSSPITVVAKKISLTSIPTCPAGQDCSGRNIWRNKNGGSIYYLVTTIADNTTTIFTDDVADTSLGARLNDFLGENLQNKRFPSCRYLISHQNRLVGALDETTPDRQTIFISNSRAPWYSPLLPDFDDPEQGTRIPLQGPGAGTITGIHSHGDKIAVFTGGAAYLLTTSDQLLDYSLHRFSDHGCVAHRAIQSFRDMLLWLATDGVYLAAEGVGVVRISDDIEGLLPLTDAAQMSKANAFVLGMRYYLCFQSSAFYWDSRYRTWGQLTAWPWRDTTVSVYTTSAEQRVYGSRSGVARAWQMETGATDNGTAIPAIWQSAGIDLGLPYRDKRIHRIGAEFKKGTGTATVKLYRDTGSSPIQTATLDLTTEPVTGSQISRLDQRAVEQARAEFFSFSVEHADAAATDFEIEQVKLMYSQAG